MDKFECDEYLSSEKVECNYVRILHTDKSVCSYIRILHTNLSVCNYIQILHTDLSVCNYIQIQNLHVIVTYDSFTYGFLSVCNYVLHTDLLCYYEFWLYVIWVFLVVTSKSNASKDNKL